ncbi:hypothetical protein D1007_26791 [Hordeum vulgare]|nr:hypothetical protein D1007_26791 [Hordeum vulgare]
MQFPLEEVKIAETEEEIEELTALSLGSGSTSNSKHSKSKRATGSNPNPKLPVQLKDLFPDQDSDEHGDDHPRKKLRLSAEQVTVLESVYEEHCNLDTTVKQGLAKRLDIKPRQVEVWFQNRRARSKQKQVVEDYEHVKRKSERLIKENQKLKMELQQLTSISQRGSTKNGVNLVTVCSFCDKIFRDHHGQKKL